MKRVVVVGGGPVGLAAALGAVRRGLEPVVLERDRVGAHVRRWGAARFFSPVGWNASAEMIEALGRRAPPLDALLTGPEFADDVLEPLAASGPLEGRVRTGVRVVAIGRAGLRRGDYAGHPLRSERPFRLLVDEGGEESWIEADAVLDASGTYGQPNRIGAGGLWAPGERTAPAIRDLGALHAALPSLAGRRVLLAGHGHSAAHALAWLGEAGASVVLATRVANLRPFLDVADDPLPERARVVREANRLASSPPRWLRVERRASVEALRAAGDGVEVKLSGGRGAEVHAVVGLVGYRPDLDPLSELAIEIAPATGGAAGLERALSSVTDCLSVPAVAPRDLASGETGFHLIGAKSYGRATTFLLRTGYGQLATILDGLVRP